MKLSAVRRDPSVFKSGEWVHLPGDEFDGAAILTRGFTDAYMNAKNAAFRRVSSAYGGAEKVPVEKNREVVINAMVDHVLLDVRGIEDDAGQPITLDAFVACLRDQPSYEYLYTAVIAATAMAGVKRAADIEEAAGN